MNIGLIGAENSHTKAFGKLFNTEGKSPGNRITHVYGDDSAEAAEKLAAEFGLTICATEEELLAACDAVVITYRCGSRHYEPAMRALKAGKAVFNDKPFAATAEQAKALGDYAAANGLLLTGGSSWKSVPAVLNLRKELVPGSTAVISYGADVASPYDGFTFYGIHSVELCLSLFGTDYKSVSAVNHHGAVVATVVYETGQCVIMTRPDVYDLQLLHVTPGQSTVCDMSDMGGNICPEEFAKMLETNKAPHPYGSFAESITLLTEIMDKAGLQAQA